eukprot:6231288-Pyramimonas_sp.AAC.1
MCIRDSTHTHTHTHTPPAPAAAVQGGRSAASPRPPPPRAWSLAFSARRRARGDVGRRRPPQKEAGLLSSPHAF